MAQQDTSKHGPADEVTEFAQDLSEHIRAGYQCLYVPTSEENRLENEIGRVIKRVGGLSGMITWDCIEGFSGPERVKDNKKFRIPLEALQALGSQEAFSDASYVFVFRDLDDYFADPSIRRVIRTLCEQNGLVNKRWKRPLIITSPLRKIHDKIKPCMTLVDFALPTERRLTRVFDFVKASIESTDPQKAFCSDELRSKAVQCLMGLTSVEAENVMSRCLVKHGGFKDDMLATIKDEKAGIIKKSEVLTYIPETQQASPGEIGGFENLLEFVERRRLAYGPAARAIGLDFPKGVVLIGVPGTGKSMVGKALARLFGLPGYILDVSSVFGSLVGESEQRMRDALRQVEAQQGCVLIIDEADKALGGATDSNGDNGVSRRVFGQLLTWLAEKNDKTFVVITLNRTRGIPPEFLRAGRFDKVFWTDLPNEAEREQILKIHLRKRGVDPDKLGFAKADWEHLVEATQDFVGSELEQMVVDSRYLAFQRRQVGDPSFDELVETQAGIVPLARLDKEGVELIREFCRDRATPVNKPTAAAATAAPKRRRSVDLGSGN